MSDLLDGCSYPKRRDVVVDERRSSECYLEDQGYKLARAKSDHERSAEEAASSEPHLSVHVEDTVRRTTFVQ